MSEFRSVIQSPDATKFKNKKTKQNISFVTKSARSSFHNLHIYGFIRSNKFVRVPPNLKNCRGEKQR